MGITISFFPGLENLAILGFVTNVVYLNIDKSKRSGENTRERIARFALNEKEKMISHMSAIDKKSKESGKSNAYSSCNLSYKRLETLSKGKVGCAGELGRPLFSCIYSGLFAAFWSYMAGIFFLLSGFVIVLGNAHKNGYTILADLLVYSYTGDQKFWFWHVILCLAVFLPLVWSVLGSWMIKSAFTFVKENAQVILEVAQKQVIDVEPPSD